MNKHCKKAYIGAFVVSAVAVAFISEQTRDLLLAGLSALSSAALIVILSLMLLQPGLVPMVSASIGLLMLFVFFYHASRKEIAIGDISTRQPKLVYDAAIAVVTITAITALWMGEHHTAFIIPENDANAALIPPIVVLFLLWRAGRMKATCAAIGIYILFLVIWFTGSKEANLAFNDCVHNGESVRVELAKYKSLHERFPETLSDLDTHLPGRLIFPPHLLRYERTPDGYKLSFSDFLVSHAATESQAFIAYK